MNFFILSLLDFFAKGAEAAMATGLSELY